MTREEAGKLRVWLLCEDSRQDRFFRRLLVREGVEPRRIDVQIAPAGAGSAAAWVLARYPEVVRRLRSKKHQIGLCVVAVIDGDNEGVEGRKRALDAALRRIGQDVRSPGEKIALPVPTWSVETWLWWLLGEPGTTEAHSMKSDFERKYGRRSDENVRAVDRAVLAWPGPEPGRPPSLGDGLLELARLLP